MRPLLLAAFLVSLALLNPSSVDAQGIKPPVMAVQIGTSSFAPQQVLTHQLTGDLWRCPGPYPGHVVVVLVTNHGATYRVCVAVTNSLQSGGSGGNNILQGITDVDAANFKYTNPHNGIMRYIGGPEGPKGENPLPLLTTFKVN